MRRRWRGDASAAVCILLPRMDGIDPRVTTRPNDLIPAGRLRGFEAFTGHRAVVLEGNGANDSMYREVTYWFDEHGVLIRRDDPAVGSKI